MTEFPKISVILTINNNTKYLRKCLNSICCQTYNNLEIICVNNGSTDDCLDVLNGYKEQDDRIKVFSQDKFCDGIAYTLGLQNVTGEYITFVNPDDWLLLTLYETFADTVNRIGQNVDIYLFNTGLYTFGVNDVVPQKLFNIKDWNSHTGTECIHVFNDCLAPFSGVLSLYNKIYNRSFIINNNINFPDFLHFGELYFSFKSLLKANSILINEDVLYRERVFSKETSSNVFDIFKIMDLIEKEINACGLYEDYKYALFQFKYQTFVAYYKQCPKTNRESYYNTMKFRLIASETPDLDKNIISNLINYSVYEKVKQSTRRDFENSLH